MTDYYAISWGGPDWAEEYVHLIGPLPFDVDYSDFDTDTVIVAAEDWVEYGDIHFITDD